MRRLAVEIGEQYEFHHVKTPLARVVEDPAYKGLPLQVQIEVAKDAARAQLRGEQPGEFELIDYVTHPDVLTFAVWLCARKQHKDLRQDEIAAEVAKVDSNELQVLAGEIMGFFHQASSETAPTGPSTASPGDGGTSPKAEPVSTAS